MSTPSSHAGGQPPRAPSPEPCGLRCETLTTPDALAALRGEWQRLWLRSAQATPFQSWQWLLPWWKHLGQGTLASVAVRDTQGALAGLAPLYIHDNAATGLRHLFPIGIGTSDCLDLLAAPGFERAVAAAVLQALAACAGRWDVIEIPQLPRDAVLLRADMPPGWSREVEEGEPSPALRLAPDSPGALPIPSSIAANLRTCRNRAARAGGLAYETADARTVHALLDELARLHGRRWDGRGETGVLADPAVRAMHAEAAPLLLEAGLLRLHAVRLAGECIAAVYCLHDATPGHVQRCAYYIGGFDPRQAALSPGTLAIAHAIGRAAAEGATVFDFLRGREGYKYRWGAADAPMFTLRLRAPGPPGARPA